MPRAVAYIRVSTRAQDERNQLYAIRKFARERGIELLEGLVFIDKGESRLKKWRERPAARKLVEWLERGGGKDVVDYVIVFDMTRLGTDIVDVLDFFMKLERELGVRVVSVNDPWLQTEDESLRKLLIAILTWVSEREIALRRERQQAAWEAGKPKGRPPTVEDNELVRIWRTYRPKGYSKKAIWAIAKELYAQRGRKFISYTRFLERINKLCREKQIQC